jgi:hypothetical protein
MRVLSGLSLLLWLFTTPPLWASGLKSDEEIIYFPTSGAWSAGEGGWRVPLHGWVFEAERDSLWREGALEMLKRHLGLSAQSDGSHTLRERGWPFLVDNERSKQITLQIAEHHVDLIPSGANGHLYGETFLNGEAGNSTAANCWLSFTTRMPEGDPRHFSGAVQLIEEEGISVISDIDDTIKISNVLDKEELLANTFLREFRPVPGMVERYRQWHQQGAAFHYVTGSPWQLYPSLEKFIEKEGFPRGSFAMRNFRLKDASLIDFLTSSHDYKVTTIDALLKRYPKRHFILVGDSGEQDPEVYGEIARRYPQQVAAIYIHNVSGELVGDVRLQSAFAGVAEGGWRLFGDGGELVGDVVGLE